ncbi:MAG: tRNA (5-methylaminomethyl-2-thiouridine)(34)-methyltransferase MnmD [Bacteroidota bacterium]|jgi:tRNA U34 5-methylaminomethyl-2-thiouridine-forming methyltransferase MnmC
MNHVRIKTADGSSTLLHEVLGETYHSTKGAVEESVHVYINAGLKHLQEQRKNNSLHLLEVGYGTGLNALLTMIHSIGEVHYTAIEPFPLPEEEQYTARELQALGYQIPDAIAANHWTVPIAAKQALFQRITARFFLRKLKCSLSELHAPHTFDLVYYDAFAPKYQPEMWTAQSWNHLKTLMKPGSVAVTYCAQGAFRRMLQIAHWQVERLRGAKGHKREMIRATLCV